MTISEYVEVLGEATGHGWGFLTAYGLTWLVCAVLWLRSSARVAAYGTLFQGMVALPVALLLTELTPGPPRPVLDGMQSLTILLSSGQLLALPVVIYLVVRQRYTAVPLAMVLVLVVHFAPYSWLYGTPLYLVMGAAVSLAAVAASASARDDDASAATSAGRVCLTTGTILLLCAAVAWLL
ncbi:DUF7010 family protein [Ornithinimicrobium cryptoxanthini]|uniref:Integral membrane protein n=1 Tax=Ornithinimicrobium cryptoxanthini TaxID=2934161 RepID=A0ABY4YMH5_9MICO|nr:hypothetical protein [Ornithinimicrobium cryptoxanthini]USQ77553.1 hypothetical protein NF557_06510 [Ornithinimicrobium cryptoxanthini]